MISNWYRPRNIRSMWFGEGEGEGTGDGGAEGGDKGGDKGGAKPPAKPDPKTEKKFSQTDLDRVIDQRFKKEREEKEGLVKQLQQLQDNSNLTAAEKEALASQIEDLNASMRTKEETAALNLKTQEGKYKQQIEGLSGERDTWKTRFVESTKKRSLTDAAVAANAEEPSQIVMMFDSQTRLEEEKVDGKPTGNYVTMMKFQGIDPETKKPVTLDMSPAEAFQHMRENGLHKNLWKHGGKPGTGADAGGGGGSKNPGKEPQRDDYASSAEYGKAYQAWRDNYNLDGTPKTQKK